MGPRGWPSLSLPERPPELSPLPSLPPERPQAPGAGAAGGPPPPTPRASSSRLFQPLLEELALRTPASAAWLFPGGMAPHSPLVVLLWEPEEVEEDEDEEEAPPPQGRGPCPAGPGAGLEALPQGMPLGTGAGLPPGPCSQRGAPAWW